MITVPVSPPDRQPADHHDPSGIRPHPMRWSARGAMMISLVFTIAVLIFLSGTFVPFAGALRDSRSFMHHLSRVHRVRIRDSCRALTLHNYH